ncbi:MAG TPA: DUF2905 domain-containing protein [Candidatus Acidoferrum sp.]
MNRIRRLDWQGVAGNFSRLFFLWLRIDHLNFSSLNGLESNALTRIACSFGCKRQRLALDAGASARSILYNIFVDPLREIGRTLLVLGGLLVVVGALLYFGGRLPLRFGRLPGDIVHRGEHTTFHFPIVTCLLLSAVLTLLFWLASHLRK